MLVIFNPQLEAFFFLLHAIAVPSSGTVVRTRVAWQRALKDGCGAVGFNPTVDEKALSHSDAQKSNNNVS